jgi:hypothetical protein
MNIEFDYRFIWTIYYEDRKGRFPKHGNRRFLSGVQVKHPERFFMYCSKTTLTVSLAACLTIGGLAIWILASPNTDTTGKPAEAAVENIGGNGSMNLNGLLRWIK